MNKIDIFELNENGVSIADKYELAMEKLGEERRAQINGYCEYEEDWNDMVAKNYFPRLTVRRVFPDVRGGGEREDLGLKVRFYRSEKNKNLFLDLTKENKCIMSTRNDYDSFLKLLMYIAKKSIIKKYEITGEYGAGDKFFNWLTENQYEGVTILDNYIIFTKKKYTKDDEKNLMEIIENSEMSRKRKRKLRKILKKRADNLWIEEILDYIDKDDNKARGDK